MILPIIEFGICVLGGIGLTIAIFVTFFKQWQNALIFDPNWKYDGCGFDKNEFAAFALLTFGSATAFTMLYVAACSLHTTSRLSVAPVLVLGLASVFVGIAALVKLGDDALSCFIIACPGTDPNLPANAPLAAGWNVVVGFAAFFSLVPIGLVLIGRAAVAIFAGNRGVHTISTKREWLLMGDEVSAYNYTSADRRLRLRVAGFAVTCVVVLVSLLIFTAYLPDNFKSFTSGAIAANAATAYESPCFNSSSFGGYCPEYPWAVFHTTSHRISDTLALSFFPSNVFFYSYMLLVVVLGYLINAVRTGRQLMSKPLIVSRRLAPLGFRAITVGSLAFSSLTLAFLILFIFYWMHDHSFNRSWGSSSAIGIDHAQRWARGLGQTAVILISLLFVPASRGSLVHEMLGTSYEAFLWFHRVLGVAALGAIFGHMTAWYQFLAEHDAWPAGFMMIPPFALPLVNDCLNFTIPLGNVVGFTCLILGLPALIPQVRRKYFELFYYAHVFAAYSMIPVVLWHATAGWEYFLPGLTLWFADRLLRLVRSGRDVSFVRFSTRGAFVRIDFRQPSLRAAPGQYVFINVPEISILQWHPFSICSDPSADVQTLCIRDMGPGTWTGKLREAILAGRNLSLAVDGPAGRARNFLEYDTVVLVAGGIGVTPCASILRTLLRTHTNAALIWTLREAELVDVLALESAHASRAKIFLTNSASTLGVNENAASVTYGRPSLHKELAAALPSDKAGGSVLVFGCGPESMLGDVQEIAVKRGWEVHCETFFL